MSNVYVCVCVVHFLYARACVRYHTFPGRPKSDRFFYFFFCRMRGREDHGTGCMFVCWSVTDLRHAAICNHSIGPGSFSGKTVRMMPLVDK